MVNLTTTVVIWAWLNVIAVAQIQPAPDAPRLPVTAQHKNQVKFGHSSVRPSGLVSTASGAATPVQNPFLKFN